MLGDLHRAKLSRGRMLVKIASDNGVDLGAAEEAAVGLELVHLATLVHDDVIDDADLRRDRANLRSQRGDRAAILCGDFLFSASIRQIQATQPETSAKIFTEQVEDTCRGESIQDLMLTWEDSQPTMELLEQAARGKTGALFSYCTQAPLALDVGKFSEQLPKAKECGYLCGLGFQLADDLLDIAGSESDLGKPAGNDLVKNTMTIPLFLFMKELGLDWAALRERYVNRRELLGEDFKSSNAKGLLEKRLKELRLKLFELGEELEENGVVMIETLQIFWSRYVEGRMAVYADSRD